MMKQWLSVGLLAPLALLGAEWTLDDLRLSSIEQGWGTPLLNRSLDGNDLSVAGEKFTRGLGSHAPGNFTLMLDGQAVKLSGAVGIDDEVGTQGDVTVRIFANKDDQELLLWDSGLLKGGDKAAKFTLLLDGVTQLRVVMDDLGNKNQDHVDLLDWQLEYKGAAPVAKLPPGVVATDNVYWFFNARPGEPLTQNGFGSADSARVSAPALLPYPLRGQTNFMLDENLRIIQADGAHTVALVFDRVEERELADGIVEKRYFLKDNQYPVRAEYVVTAYQREDVIKSRLEVINDGTEAVQLLNRDAVFVAFNADDETYLTNFYGEWGREMTGFNEEKIVGGVTKHQHRGAIRTAWPDWAGCYLSFDGKAQEESGDVFAAALAWTGSWQYKISKIPNSPGHPYTEVFFSAGAQEDPVKLAAGARYTSPEVVMTFSTQGKGQASRNLHRYLVRDGITNPDAQRRIVLNSWEGVYFTFDENKIIAMMDGAADLGVEMFVLDDGWFGNGQFQRNGDNAGLGDWQVNTEKLPNGLEKLIDAAEARGLEFGLWVEPEMVNPVSNLFQTHPDWAMEVPNRDRYPARNQYVLDLSQPEVEAFVYDTVSGILKAHPRIHYIKWDHNCVGLNLGSPKLGDNQGAVSDLHTQAYYRIMEKLRKNFPNVTFQLCASGGGRVDYGSMRYNEEFWASDETNAIKRIPIQWGFSHFFPARTIASHIGRYGDGDFKLRTDVAMTARLGVELSPDAISPEDRDVVRRGIAAYKEIRPLLHKSELYRGRSPHESSVTELTFVAPGQKEAVFFAFQRETPAQPQKLKLKMSGLNPDSLYQFTEINPDAEPRFIPATKSGRELMQDGLEISFPAKPSSAVAKLQAL